MKKPGLMLISPMLHQGGFERVCVTVARLMEPYYEVTVVIFDDANIAYDVEGIHIVNLQLGVQKGKVRKLWNVWRRVRSLRALKRSMKPHIAYSFGATANVVNALSKTPETLVWLGLRNYTDLLAETKMKLYRKKADIIISCSKEIEAVLHEKFHFYRTATLYNLYDVPSIQETAARNNPKLPYEGDITWLVSMGRDDEMKGFAHMLKAFKLVHDKHPQTRLMILGAGTYDRYRKLAAELNIADAVYFAGMQREPYGYLKNGAIYLLTSQNEGFPNALVEGMSLGLAAVSVDCKTGPAEILLEKYETGIKEVKYGEYGILLPEMEFTPDYRAAVITNEEKQLAEVVVQLLEDKALLKKYQEAAIARAQFFSYESYVQQQLKLDSDRC